MDETQRSTAGTNSSSLRDSVIQEENENTDILAPVSIKGSQQINKVFRDLFESWNNYTTMEDGDRLATILQNYTVEEQLERMKGMKKEEIIDIFRFNLRKMTTVQEENDLLTRRNREMSERLHRIEHRVGKAQIKVFQKMEETTKEVLKDFHDRELLLARRVETLEAEKSDLSAKYSKSQLRIEDFEKKKEILEAKNRILSELNDDNGKKYEEMAMKNEALSDEVFHLREELEKANNIAKEKSDEAMRELFESRRVKALILEEREKANIKAAKHEDQLVDEMNEYKSRIEEEVNLYRIQHKKEVDTLKTKYDATVAHKDSVIQDLTEDIKQKNRDIQRLKQHVDEIEARIKGDVKRSLAANYHNMLNIVSNGSARVPLRENPFYDMSKENDRKHEIGFSSCPSSPKRTLGVQTAAEPEPARRSQPSEKPKKVQRFASSVNIRSDPFTHRK